MSLFKRLTKVISSRLFDSEHDPSIKARFDQTASSHEADNYYAPKMDEVEKRYRANLEVGLEEGIEEIRAKYRLLLKKYHPDLHAGSMKKSKIATEITQQLNEAMNYFEKKYGGS